LAHQSSALSKEIVSKSLNNFFIFLITVIGFFSAGIIYFYSIQGIILIVGLVILFTSIYYFPEISLIFFLFLPSFKDWFMENIPIFESIDLTILSFFIVVTAVLIKYMKSEIEFNFIKKYPNIFWSFIFFVAIVSISFLYTRASRSGLEKLLKFSILNTGIFLSSLVLFQGKQTNTRSLNIITVIASILGLSLLGVIVYNLFKGNIVEYFLRFSMLSANPISVARFISIGMILIFYRILKEDRPSMNLILWVFLGLLFVSLIGTASRGPLLSVMIGLTIYAYCFSNIDRWKLWLLGLGFILFILLMVLILPEGMTRRFMIIGSPDTSIVFQGKTRQVSTIFNRFYFWQLSLITMFKNLRNFIFGLGIGGFSSLFILKDFRIYPHNMFFEVLVEFGILGFGFFMWHFISSIEIIRKYFKNNSITSNNLPIPWLIISITIFISSMFSGNLTDNRMLWLFFGGFLCAVQSIIDINANPK